MTQTQAAIATRSDGMIVPLDALVQLRAVGVMEGLSKVTDERLLQEIRTGDWRRYPSDHPANPRRLKEPDGGWDENMKARLAAEWVMFKRHMETECPNCQTPQMVGGGKLYLPAGKAVDRPHFQGELLPRTLIEIDCPVCGSKGFTQHLIATCGVKERTILLKPDDYWWFGEQGREAFDKMIRMIITQFTSGPEQINEWWTFISPYGDGKSTALQVIASKLAHSGIKARYITAEEFDDRVNDAMSNGDWGRPPIVDALLNVQVLCFDQPDWLKQGTYENPSPAAKWFRAMMDERNRLRPYLATIIAVNKTFEDNGGGAVLAPVLDRIYAGKIARAAGNGIRQSLGEEINL